MKQGELNIFGMVESRLQQLSVSCLLESFSGRSNMRAASVGRPRLYSAWARSLSLACQRSRRS
jgi:hypothetical protein